MWKKTVWQGLMHQTAVLVSRINSYSLRGQILRVPDADKSLPVLEVELLQLKH